MKLNSLFTDNAVLQRGVPVPVWGVTTPSAYVMAEIAGVKSRTQADVSGGFILRLPPLPEGGPYTLEVATDDGKGRASVKGIMVGEVWICSGQSNMQFAVQQVNEAPKGDADHDMVRMITVPCVSASTAQTDFDASWQIAGPSNFRTFSAVGYYFACRLQKELGVPVGMIHSSWGGTRIEAWTSRSALMQMPSAARDVLSYEAALANPLYWESAAEVMDYPQDPGSTAEALRWAEADYDDSQWNAGKLPMTFSVCCGREINGALWFRKDVELPPSWNGRKLKLHIGSADKHDVTYFNGVQVGATGSGVDESHWYELREYEVPAELVKGGRASIAVRVWSFVYDGGLRGPEDEMRLCLADSAEDGISLAGEWKYRIEHDIGVTPPKAPQPPLPGDRNAVHSLFDGMINPLVPYAIRGALWYQGESNENNPHDYFTLLCGMISDWRRAWGQGDFPFISVQLANFRAAQDYEPDSRWAYIRGAQLAATRALQNVGMASAVDVGEALDIHPMNKMDVGCRLAQWALAKTYGKDIPPNGPHYSGYVIDGDSVRINFDDSQSGLVAKDGGMEIRGCVIAGADRKFAPAEARVEGGKLVVRSDAVQKPVAVRYAWADNPENANLYNTAGLPASPFRTDSWPN